MFKIIELMVNSQTCILFFVYLFDVTKVLWKRLSADGRTIKLPKRKGKKKGRVRMTIWRNVVTEKKT